MIILTVKERIILCLKEEAEISQDHIAKTLQIAQGPVSRALGKLKREKIISEKTGESKEGKKRVKIYSLAEGGRKRAEEIEKGISNETIIVTDLDGKEKETKFSKVNDLLKKTVNKTFMATEILNALEKNRLDIKKLIQRSEKNIDFASERLEVKSFYGRERELKEIDEFVDSKSKILSLKGITGIGKTVLVTKALEKHKQRYNVFWHRFHEFSTTESMLRYLSDFLSEMKKHRLRAYVMMSREKIEKIDVLMILEGELKNVNSILVFDDCHKIEKQLPDFLKEFLLLTKRIDSLKIILSGRWAPKIYDKKDVLDGFVKELTLEGLDKKSSGQLLQERGIEKGIDKIYSMTKGHPLLLELIKSETTIAEDVYSFLKDAVYNQLNADERELLCLSSAFRFPFKGRVFLENNLSVDLVDELVDKSLMQRSGDIYDEHDLIRRFFYKRLTEREKIRYHGIAGSYYEKESGEQAILEAMHHYIQADYQERTGKIIIKNGEKLIKKGYLNEFMSILKGLDLRRVPKHELVRISLLRGDIYEIKGEWEKSLSQAKSALRLAEELGNKKQIVESYQKMGRIDIGRANYDKALEELRKALQMSEELNDAHSVAETHYWLGKVSWHLGKLDDATKHLFDCLNLARETGDKSLVGKAIMDIGTIHQVGGDYKESLEYSKRSLSISEKLDDKYEIARAYSNIGTTYGIMGDLERAIEWYEKQIELSREIGHLRYLGYGLSNAAETYGKLNKLDRAKDYTDEALNIFTRLGEKRMIGACHMVYGVIYHKKNEWNKSSERFERAIKIAKEIEDLDSLSQDYFQYGKMFADKGDKGKAKEQFEKSIATYMKLGNKEKVKEIEKELLELS